MLKNLVLRRYGSLTILTFGMLSDLSFIHLSQTALDGFSLLTSKMIYYGGDKIFSCSAIMAFNGTFLKRGTCKSLIAFTCVKTSLLLVHAKAPRAHILGGLDLNGHRPSLSILDDEVHLSPVAARPVAGRDASGDHLLYHVVLGEATRVKQRSPTLVEEQ